MVRRSSLIIAASLAVLSTFEPGAFCFAAAAPAAAPRDNDADRFERPRFLRREVHRFVFANTSTPAVPVVVAPDTTTKLPTPIDSITTTPAGAGNSPTPDEIAASLSAASVAAVDASLSGEGLGASLPGPTTTHPSPNPNNGAPTTTPPPAETNTPPNAGGQSTTPGQPNNGGQTTKPTDSLPGELSSVASTVLPSLLPGQGQGSTTAGNHGQSPTDTEGAAGGQSPTPTTHPLIPGQSEGAGNSEASNGAGTEAGSSTGGGILPIGGLTSTGPNGLPVPLPTSLPGAGGGASPGSSAPTAVPATGTNAEGGNPIVTPGTQPTDLPGSSLPGFSLGGVSNTALPGQSASLPVGGDSLLNALTSALATNNNLPTQSTLPNGAVVPLSVPTGISLGPSVVPSEPVVANIPASIVSNGQTIANPSFTQQPAGNPSATQPGPTASLPIESLAPVSSGSAPQNSGQPASVTLPNGSVVPNTNTESTPSQTHGAALVAGQSSASGSQAVESAGSQNSGASVIAGQSASGSQQSASEQSGSQQSASAVPGSQSSGVVASEGSQATAASAAVAGSAPPAPSPTSPAVAASPPTSLLPVATVSQSYNTEQNGPLTQRPTGYDSATAQPVPSSILLMPSSSSPSASSDFGPTGLPSGVPLVLYPPTGPVNRPENTDLIQIGFLYPLNYDFVWTHEESQRQIFKYLPIGIAFGLELEIDNVTMQTLRAWDTTQDLHYITTLALAWIPSNLVDSLGLILHTQAEKFYHNPDPAVRTLLSMINPALPIRADNATDGGSNTAFGASPTGTGTTDNGAPIGNGINNSSPVKASSVGIGVGVVCGAAAYGAAMFFVARRYKKRRQSHMRSPSMYSSPVMSHTGPDPAAGAALMSGGMGERSMSPYYDNDRGPSRGSGRSGSSAGRQQISAPVMAENSLGWN